MAPGNPCTMAANGCEAASRARALHSQIRLGFNMSTSTPASPAARHPSDTLSSFEAWEDFMEKRYPLPSSGEAVPPSMQRTMQRREGYRDYRAEARPCVKEFYRLNHAQQTLDVVRAKEREFGSLARREMTVWEAVAWLDSIVDDSDPDNENSQIWHALQSGEAAREAGMPRWFILTTFIHDLGKILCCFGEPQWAVVGDTFPVGCRFSEGIVFHEFFEANPDAKDPVLGSEHGIYVPGCGLDQVHMSWGHDEYLYRVTRDRLPLEAQYVIRYHSFYPLHREHAYLWMLNDQDRRMLKWVKAFNPFDLYSKGDAKPDAQRELPFYRDLVDEFLPGKLRW